MSESSLEWCSTRLWTCVIFQRILFQWYGVLSCWHYIWCQCTNEWIASDRTTLSTELWWTDAVWAIGVVFVWYQTSVHSVWWKEAIRSVYFVHGLGQTLRLPVVPIGSEWKLWRLEGYVHWKQFWGNVVWIGLQRLPCLTRFVIRFQAAVSILKQELNEELIELANAQDLAVKVLSKTLDMTKLTSEKGQLFKHRISLKRK